MFTQPLNMAKLTRSKRAKRKTKDVTTPRPARNVVEIGDIFAIHDGVPRHRNSISQEDQKKVMQLFRHVKPNTQHFVVPSKIKAAVLRIAKMNFPEYQIRTSTNKTKGTVSVWRVK